MSTSVRALEPQEIINPEDGIWIFPNADGYLQRIKDVLPSLIGKPAGIYSPRIKREIPAIAT